MKRILTITAACGVMALTAAPAFSQVGLEIHGLYAFNFDAEIGGVEIEPDDVFGGGASVVFKLGRVGRIDLGGDYLRTTVGGAVSNDVTLIPVTAALRLGVPIKEALFLYVGGGAGWSFNDIDSRFVKLKDGLVYFGCGGIEVNLGAAVALRGEFRYLWHNPDIEFRAGEIGLTEQFGRSTDFQLDHMQARAGLVFWF